MRGSRRLLVAATLLATAASAGDDPRAREVGLVPGVLDTGPLNAITDVAGVRVGHVTLRDGPSVNTGVTVIIPGDGDVFREKRPAAIYVANGYGKLAGLSQVQ
ncbi:MAG: P1 family peptidase, partial [Pseudomonadota bacterium]